MVPAVRLAVALLTLAVTACVTSGCTGTGRFNISNARAHVERLAGAIGTRPAGTENNEKARAYLIETLQLYGFEVRVQEADAIWPENGQTTRVANIIAIRPGQQAEAIGLIAHHDSVPAGPGAADDGFGVAVVLESARVLAARQAPRHTLMVLLTDGEELGLMGARALVSDPEVRARLKTYVNIEAVGSGEPVVLFETGPGSGPALRAWANGSRPRGGSYMQSIYDRLPNDTDLSIFRRENIFGLNLAAVGDGYAYHTDRDRPDRLASGALGRAGDVILGLVNGLERVTSLPGTPEPSMYFSIANRWAVVWSMRSAMYIGAAVVVLGLLLWFGLARLLLRAGGILRLVMTLTWAAIATGGVLGALFAAVWLVRHARAELHPWYAAPWRLFLFMLVMAIAVSWLVRRFSAVVPDRLKPEGTPIGVWFATIPVWIALSIAGLIYAPAASYLVWVPLAACVILLPAALWRPVLARAATAGVLLVTWTLWLPELLSLLMFAVAVLGRLPIVTPLFVYPALLFAGGIMIWPPVLGLLVGRPHYRVRHPMAGGVLMLALVITGVLAVTGQSYSTSRPLRRTAVFLDDRVRGTAQWELSSNEPGVDIAAGAPPNVQWRAVSEQMITGRVGMPQYAFGFSGNVPVPSNPVPARITAFVIRRPADADIEVSIVPTEHDPLRVSLVLPENIVPTRSTLPGRTAAGRWRALHTNVPATGLTWRATVPASQADRLASTEAWISTTRLPGSVPDSDLPAWLSAERTAWSTRYTVVSGITPNDVADAQPADLGTSQFAQTSLGRLHYYTRGSGSQTLVFLHGWGGAGELWQEQVPLTQAQRALFVDLPGHGRSERLTAQYDIASQADAVRALLDAAAVQRAVLVGHSMGALVAWHVAAKDPARIQAVISIDGAFLPPAARTPEEETYLKSLAPADHAALINATIETLFTLNTPPRVRDAVLAHVRRTPPHVLVSALQDLRLGQPYAPGVYGGPVLALVARTPQTPANHEALLRQRFPQLDYRAFDNAGHFLMLERPRDVNDAIAGFLLGRGLLR